MLCCRIIPSYRGFKISGRNLGNYGYKEHWVYWKFTRPLKKWRIWGEITLVTHRNVCIYLHHVQRCPKCSSLPNFLPIFLLSLRIITSHSLSQAMPTFLVYLVHLIFILMKFWAQKYLFCLFFVLKKYLFIRGKFNGLLIAQLITDIFPYYRNVINASQQRAQTNVRRHF